MILRGDTDRPSRGLAMSCRLLALCLAVPVLCHADVWVDLAYPGVELGTAAAPYDTVAEAIAGATPGETIYLGPLDSHETLTITKACRLDSGTGTARVGVSSSIYGSGAPMEWLRIAEIMYNPSASGAEYIELQNTGPAELDISGVYFSDGIVFTFPASTTIAAGARKVLVRDSDQTAFSTMYGSVPVDGIYTGALSNSGETVALSTPADIEFLSVTYNDSASWPVLADGQGWSLVIIDPQGNGSDPNNWRASTDENGSPGASEVNPNLAGIVVNEILTHTDPDSDTIELFNTTGSAIDVRGWYLSDNDDIPLKAKIPDRAEYNIPAGGYAVITEADFFTAPGTGLPGFRLSEFGEEVFIFSADALGVLTGYSHGFEFGAEVNGTSIGRVVTTDGREHFTALSSQTFGSANSVPAIGGIVISEIHYNPVPHGIEYLRVTNRTGSSINLYDDTVGGDTSNTFKIKGIGFHFPQNQSLAAGASALIVNMPPEHYKARFGDPGFTVYGPFGNHEDADAFALSNDDETLRVMWPEHAELNPESGLVEVPYISMDHLRYDDDAPWPNADNNYSSITRSALGTFGSEPTNWTATNAPNQPASALATVADVTFSLAHGFYTGSQNLTMSTTEPSATIWYTTDGSYPAPNFGTSTQYSSTLTLSSSVAIRAAAFKTNYLPSGVTSATYILDAPAQQTAVNALAIIGDPQEDLFHPRGIMAINGGTYVRSTFNTFEWVPKLPNVAGGLADFADGSNDSQNIAGVQSENDALGNPIYVSGGADDPTAYNNPLYSGRFVERPATFEFLDPANGTNNLQVNAGVRVHGSTFHRPRYAMHPDGSGDWTAEFELPYTAISDSSLASYLKFSLRMYFRGDYGPGKLTWPIFPGDPLSPSYDKVVLRGGHNDGFNPFIKDELTRRLYIDMGRVSARGEIYSLYINGVYRGYYNAAERHDADFLASRLNTTKDWDILTHPFDVAYDPNNPQVKEGDKVHWDSMMAAVAAQTASPSPANYADIEAHLDIDAFIDYLLVQLYTGNDDWPNNNWGAAHERVPGAKWIFLVWDAEATFNSNNINKTGLNFFPFWWGGGSGLKGMDTSIARIYRACVLDAGFRSTFSTRAQTHLGPGGALDTVNVSARFTELETIMQGIMPSGETFNSYIGTTWVPNREAVLIGDLQAEGLYP